MSTQSEVAALREEVSELRAWKEQQLDLGDAVASLTRRVAELQALASFRGQSPRAAAPAQSRPGLRLAATHGRLVTS